MKLFQLALALSAASLFATMAGAQEITLKASHNANADEPYQVALERMGDILEEKNRWPGHDQGVSECPAR